MVLLLLPSNTIFRRDSSHRRCEYHDLHKGTDGGGSA